MMFDVVDAMKIMNIAVVETLVIFQQACPVHILPVRATDFVFVA